MKAAVVYVGRRLKRERFARAMTQRELCERAGVTQSTLVALENNRQEPHPSTLKKLADALGVEPRVLIEDFGQED